MKTLPLALLLCTGLGSVSVTSAQSLLFDFGPTAITSGSSKLSSPGHVSGDVTGGEITWNQIGITDVTSGLKFGDNSAATGVGIDLGIETGDATNIIGFSSNPTSSLQGNNAAYNAGIYVSDAPARDFIFVTGTNPIAIGARVSGLTEGVYNVYISGANTNASAAGTMNFYAAVVGSGATTFDFNSASTASATNDPTGGASWTAGVNYVMYSVSITATQNLVIAASGTGATSGGRGFLNSLEVVRVGDITNIPEPGTFAGLAGLIALGACCLRRGRRV